MRWYSHTLIAVAMTAPFGPGAAAPVALGATAPDWLEYLYKALTKRKIEHRGVTHAFCAWFVSSIIFGVLFYLAPSIIIYTIFFFFLGGFLHVLCDAFTYMGVPLTWNYSKKIHVLGGKIKTGSTLEIGLAAGIFVFSQLFFPFISYSHTHKHISFRSACDLNRQHVKIGTLELNVLSKKELLEKRKIPCY